MQTPKRKRLSIGSLSPLSTSQSSPSTNFTSPININEKQEKEDRRKSVKETQKRKSFLPEETNEKFSSEKVSSMYSQIIKMSMENKINQKNTWNLHLIDYIKDVIDVDGEHTNFQKASCTLDASVKIYGYRVDDTLYSSFRVLENLNRNEKPSLTEEVTQKVVEKGKSTKLHVTETIEKNKTSLNTKDYGTVNTIDPLFKHMSKLFDAGNTNGMLLNNLECYNGCMLVFDSNEDIKSLEKDDHKEDPITISIDEEDIALIKLQKPLCPELNDLRGEIGIENKLRPSIVNTKLLDTTYIPEDPTFIDSDGDNDVMNATQNVTMEEDHTVNVGTTLQKDNNYPAFSSIIDNISEYGYIDTNLISHEDWKFKKAKKVGSGKTTKGEKREKKSAKIDFEIVLNKTAFTKIKPTKSKKETSLSHFLLPQQPYDRKNLVKFFLIPNFTLKMNALNTLSQSTLTSTTVPNEYQYNNELDCSYITPDVGGDSDSEPADYEIKDLVAPDHIVRNIEIHYAKKASTVDVRRLKSTLWNLISTDFQEKESNTSLSNTLKHIDIHDMTLKPIKPPKQDNSSITFSFICLLHLANEKGLTLQNSTDLSDVTILNGS